MGSPLSNILLVLLLTTNVYITPTFSAPLTRRNSPLSGVEEGAIVVKNTINTVSKKLGSLLHPGATTAATDSSVLLSKVSPPVPPPLPPAGWTPLMAEKATHGTVKIQSLSLPSLVKTHPSPAALEGEGAEVAVKAMDLAKTHSASPKDKKCRSSRREGRSGNKHPVPVAATNGNVAEAATTVAKASKEDIKLSILRSTAKSFGKQLATTTLLTLGGIGLGYEGEKVAEDIYDDHHHHRDHHAGTPNIAPGLAPEQLDGLVKSYRAKVLTASQKEEMVKAVWKQSTDGNINGH
ncbi:hypothetical protein FRB95_000971 [Tulasnella sp. JGI-2019a]|nr:hypothetical protein FRB95_000971 [Tulasnella sp. JGI-2019a]